MLERAAHARAVATAKGRRVRRPSVVNPNQPSITPAGCVTKGPPSPRSVAKTGINRTSLYRAEQAGLGEPPRRRRRGAGEHGPRAGANDPAEPTAAPGMTSAAIRARSGEPASQSSNVSINSHVMVGQTGHNYCPLRVRLWQPGAVHGYPGGSPVNRQTASRAPTSTVTATTWTAPCKTMTVGRKRTTNTPMTSQPSQLVGVQPHPRYLLGPNHAFLVTRIAMVQR